MGIKEIIETVIESNGMNGEGVAHVDGKVVFIPYTLKGERVRAVVKSVKARYAVASVIKILDSSPFRVLPSCPHYYKCGGCDMMHVTPEYRREVLAADLAANLKKIAGIPDALVTFDNTVCSLVRNKISMPFGMRDGKVILGLYKYNTHDVEPVDCIMSGELTRAAVREVAAFANDKHLSVYDGKSGSGVLRHLVVREAGNRASVTLVINADRLGGPLESELASRLPKECDLFICPNKKRNNVILGDTVRLVSGEPRLKASVLGVELELSPLSFFQVNNAVRDALYSAAVSELNAPVLVDLYSGIGITSVLAARKCKRVYAVECVPQATEDADRTAAANGRADVITNICGDTEDVLPRIKGEVFGADVLVDPPRKGCGGAVMAAIADISPKKLVYISCEHATMCRDIKLLNDITHGAYELKTVRLFDMFPNTHHCEVLAVLSRRDKNQQ